MFVNAMPRYEILSEEALATLEGGWRRLVSELGIEFGSVEALELFRRAGQAVEGDRVRFRCRVCGKRGSYRYFD